MSGAGSRSQIDHGAPSVNLTALIQHRNPIREEGLSLQVVVVHLGTGNADDAGGAFARSFRPRRLAARRRRGGSLRTGGLLPVLGGALRGRV